MINDGNKFVISFRENLLGMIEHHAYSMFEKSTIGHHLSGLIVYYCMFPLKCVAKHFFQNLSGLAAQAIQN